MEAVTYFSRHGEEGDAIACENDTQQKVRGINPQQSETKLQ